ncbi:20201_t:CDS:1, partial [Funneliformis geosporum]
NKQQADVSLQLAVFLRRLASKGDIFTICVLFGIAEGTVILYTK